MKLPAWIAKMLAPREPPDPNTVHRSQVDEAIKARVKLGLKPWPKLPDSDYLNRVNGICRVCGIDIYGGQAISYSREGTRCGDCLNLPIPPSDPADQ